MRLRDIEVGAEYAASVKLSTLNGVGLEVGVQRVLVLEKQVPFVSHDQLAHFEYDQRLRRVARGDEPPSERWMTDRAMLEVALDNIRNSEPVPPPKVHLHGVWLAVLHRAFARYLISEVTVGCASVVEPWSIQEERLREWGHEECPVNPSKLADALVKYDGDPRVERWVQERRFDLHYPHCRCSE